MSAEIELVVADFDDYGITIALPTGWTFEIDHPSDTITVLSDDRFDDHGYVASITIERHPPLELTEDLASLANKTLEEMERTYQGFRLLWSKLELDDHRVQRAYEFHIPELDRSVRQVQGLLAPDAVFVVNCTAPLPFADPLEPVFNYVIESLFAI